MTEKGFKDFCISIEGKKYFEEIGYLRNEQYFSMKTQNTGTSDDYYMETEDLKNWAYEISKSYTPYNNDHALLIKDLLEKRKGQYSNATLYSSSRFITEMFRTEEHRVKFLNLISTKINEKLNINEQKWILEYRLPIFEDNESHPAQLDLAIIDEKKHIFIGVESKMKEIYKNYYNDFSNRYKGKLEEIKEEIKEEKVFYIDYNGGTKESPIRIKIKDHEFCNFYYKQQICHLLGMQYHKKQKSNDYKYYFLNFVFDVSEKMKCEKIKEYRENEKNVMKFLKQSFEKNGVTYLGLFTQSDLIK